MDLFKDKRYEEMDWLSRAVEPLEIKLNEVLAKLPDEYSVGYEELCAFFAAGGRSSLAMTTADLLRWIANRTGVVYQSELDKCFKLECANDVLDFTTGEHPGFKLTKIKPVLDDKHAKEVAMAEARRQLSYNRSWRSADLSRVNEIADLLDCAPETMKTRSIDRKVSGIQETITKALQEDTWHIRNLDLIPKIAKWIALYSINGDLGAWANLCHFKVMTHSEQPIYSLSEVD